MTELVSFFVRKRLAVPAIRECEFCDQFVESIYPKSRLVEIVNVSTVHIVRHYGKQRSATSTDSKIVHFLKRKERDSTKIRFTQHMRISPARRAMITVRKEWECLVFATPKTQTGKPTECSAASKIQGIKRNVPFRIMVAYITAEKNIFLNIKWPRWQKEHRRCWPSRKKP